MEKFSENIKESETGISDQNNLIEQAKELRKKYVEKLKNVRNNREYNSIVKEQEYQDLEIELAEKKINELKGFIEQKNESVKELKEKIKERSNHLSAKKKELDSIMKETEKEENVLTKKSTEFEKLIEKHLIQAYKRIRGSVKNGLAIVPIQRGAAGGSFFAIPAQVQLEIASRNKIIIDEHSGRILVDPELAAEEEAKQQHAKISFIHWNT